MREQRGETRLQRLVLGSKKRQPTLAIPGRQLQRLVEQPVELRPRLRVHQDTRGADSTAAHLVPAAG